LKSQVDIDNFLGTQETEEQPRRRKKAVRDIVCLTLRMTQSQWRRAHDLSESEGVSINQLALDGISKILKEKGLPPLGN
jgi:hypothetical protein